MKLVFLMYLEDDDSLVQHQLDQMGVRVFSRMALEGHASGTPGWYGEVPPYRSKMAFAVLSDAEASALLEAVETWPGGADPQHPVRAFQVDVEAAASQMTAQKVAQTTQTTAQTPGEAS